jgi:hypothetical protein
VLSIAGRPGRICRNARQSSSYSGGLPNADPLGISSEIWTQSFSILLRFASVASNCCSAAASVVIGLLEGPLFTQTRILTYVLPVIRATNICNMASPLFTGRCVTLQILTLCEARRGTETQLVLFGAPNFKDFWVKGMKDCGLHGI